MRIPKSNRLPIVAAGMMGMLLAFGCKSNTPATSPTQTTLQVQSGAPTPQPSTPTAIEQATTVRPSEPNLLGFALGGSFQDAATAESSAGLHDAGCKDAGGGFKDCFGRKGEVGDTREGVVLGFYNGALYSVQHVFPAEGYGFVSDMFEKQYGKADYVEKGAKAWNFASGNRKLVLKAGQRGNSPMAFLVDVETYAKRQVQDAVNGTGQYAR